MRDEKRRTLAELKFPHLAIPASTVKPVSTATELRSNPRLLRSLSFRLLSGLRSTGGVTALNGGRRSLLELRQEALRLEKELEALIRIKDDKGSMEGVDDGSMLRLSRFLEENRVDLEHEQSGQADQEADEWRAREIAKDIAKRKVSKLSTCDSFEAPQDEASIVENGATREDMEPFHVYVLGWPGAAIAYVADILKVPAIFIKAVTNVVDGDKPSIVEYWQNLAAVTAALGLAVIEVVDFINGKCLSKLQVFNVFLLLPSGGYMPEKRFR
ncbi:hypothetical protein Vadar_010265 [Vaccinium darrowii]|uniref:Uncharacterized protein n=1 Tax=Vaccinium darrowii TaxID=229202 RepID=A0ACB7WZI6_9ERIC|nr:hypothetical protein Vadar_010265 [Vaccinium darrowii]